MSAVTGWSRRWGEETSMEDMRKWDAGSRNREHNGSRAETGLCTSWRTEGPRCGWSQQASERQEVKLDGWGVRVGS